MEPLILDRKEKSITCPEFSVPATISGIYSSNFNLKPPMKKLGQIFCPVKLEKIGEGIYCKTSCRSEFPHNLRARRK
jgi:hypothetical protein